MNFLRRLSLFSLIFLIGLIFLSPETMLQNNSENYNNLEFEKEENFYKNKGIKPRNSNFKIISPIEIQNNSEFDDFALSEELLGDGTSESPYIIENFSISSLNSQENLIFIKDTTKKFWIQNNYLSGGKCGIYVDNCSDFMIDNNTFHSNGYNGIFILKSSKFIISNNNISYSSYHGIEIGSSSNNNIILENLVFNCSMDGIHLEKSSDLYFKKNLISNNKGRGIAFGAASNYTIIYNTIYNNSKVGIESSIVNEINITYNNIMRNGMQAFDNFDDIYFETNDAESHYEFNFFYNHFPIDEDNDGINDVPKFVGGEWNRSENFDEHPLLEMLKDERIYVGYEPLIYFKDYILYEVTGLFKINWVESFNTYHNNISYYSIYYYFSLNNSWVLHETNLSGLEYSINTTEYEDQEFNVKVVAVDEDGNKVEKIYDSGFYIHNHLPSFEIITSFKDKIIIESEPFINWTPVIDSFGHEVWYEIYFSYDGGKSWIEMKGEYLESSGKLNLEDDQNQFSPASNSAMIKVIARCRNGASSEAYSEIFKYYPFGFWPKVILGYIGFFIGIICLNQFIEQFKELKKRDIENKKDRFVFIDEKDGDILKKKLKATIYLLSTIILFAFPIYGFVQAFIGIIVDPTNLLRPGIYAALFGIVISIFLGKKTKKKVNIIQEDLEMKNNSKE